MLLMELYETLKNLGVIIDNPETKLSHEDKSLQQHVEEIKRISFSLLKFYGLNDFRNLVEVLAEIHDIGKLHPDWSISRRRKSHIDASLEFLSKEEIKSRILKKLGSFRSSLNISQEELIDLILFLVRIHHSFINARECDYYPFLKDYVRKKHRNVLKIVDAFGIFKLADIISASYSGKELGGVINRLTREYQYYEIRDKLYEVVSNKCRDKGIKFNEDKFRFQGECSKKAGIHVLIAPTGWGKTAFSLLKATYEKPTKIFYILPTITAIRGFYEDLVKIFGNEDVGEYFYFADVELLGKDKEIDPSEYSKMLNVFRFFIPKINITTIDQIFLTLLNFRKYHLRRFCFRNCFLIIDEYHLFTPEMLNILKAIIDIYGREYQFKFLLMSATPSRSYVEYLRESIEEKMGLQIVYPIQNYKNLYEKLKRHRINLWLDRKITDEEIIEMIINKLHQGKRVLVIINTVDRAFVFFKKLKELVGKIGEKEIVLIHSRFAMKDRREREKAINGAKLLVATQVAEVSLDISFDNLFTEIAPIPSLIQRFGRVNRYSEGDIEKEFNVIITNVENPNPYSALDIELAKKLLNSHEKMINEKGESIYVEMMEVYDNVIVKRVRHGLRVYRNVIDALSDKSKFFYAFLEGEEKAIKIWRDDTSVLAIPECYVPKIVRFRQKLSATKNYSERRKILANMKMFFLPVSWNIAKGNYDEELRLFVIPAQKYRYSKIYGLIRAEKVDLNTMF